MAKPPAVQKFDFNASLRTVFRAAEKIGVDASLYIVVAIGTFSSITIGQANPYAVALTTLTVLGSWTGNKVVNAVVLERRERRELEELKRTKGGELLEVHRDWQKHFPSQEPHNAEVLKDRPNAGDDVDE